MANPLVEFEKLLYAITGEPRLFRWHQGAIKWAAPDDHQIDWEDQPKEALVWNELPAHYPAGDDSRFVRLGDHEMVVNREDVFNVIDWWRHANEAPGGCTPSEALKGMAAAVSSLYQSIPTYNTMRGSGARAGRVSGEKRREHGSRST